MTNQSIQACVVGAAGRMGQRTVEQIGASDQFTLVAAVDTPDAARDRDDLSSDIDAAVRAARVVIDFSAPPACVELAPRCGEHGTAYLCASTALSMADREALAAAATRVPVLAAANLSIGVNVLAGLVESAVRALGDDFDLEIFEIHHRAKRDAPSGTAHLLAEAARSAREGLRPLLGRSGNAVREPDELGMGAARGGDASGEHTVFLLGEGERIELTHRATTPDIFARGALVAARWLVGQEPGSYSMADVLGR
jgi:4-hydroxy-tetrahydrodipicolinate reductase